MITKEGHRPSFLLPILLLPIFWAALAITASSADAAEIYLDSKMPYADRAAISSDCAILTEGRPGMPIVAVNAGHGTEGGMDRRTLCHPDGSPKITDGTTKRGSLWAVAVSEGTTMKDGTREAVADLRVARLLRDDLLARGYGVLMLRQSDDVQLDNVARTVIANSAADCHVSIHFDSTETDKGAFAAIAPRGAFRKMEPVKNRAAEHDRLADCVLSSLRKNGVKLFKTGKVEIDLTQTSYSTIPSLCLECGDRISDISEAACRRLAAAICDGIEAFFGRGASR